MLRIHLSFKNPWMDGRSMQFQKDRGCIGNWGNNQGLMITIFSRRLENGFLLLFFYDLELENRKSKKPLLSLAVPPEPRGAGRTRRPTAAPTTTALRPPVPPYFHHDSLLQIHNLPAINLQRSGGRTTQEQIARKLHLASGLQERIMASKSEVDRKEPVNEQMVANMYTAMRSELNQIYSKITELEMEASEHSLVINAIQPLDHSRRCYRMIGGVLVERTIKEVLPAVQRNKEGIEEVITRLNEALETKKKEIADFEAKYKIRIRKADSEVKDEGNKKEAPSQGVLVGPAASSSE